MIYAWAYVLWAPFIQKLHLLLHFYVTVGLFLCVCVFLFFLSKCFIYNFSTSVDDRDSDEDMKIRTNHVTNRARPEG